jgi:hypothetical protein
MNPVDIVVGETNMKRLLIASALFIGMSSLNAYGRCDIDETEALELAQSFGYCCFEEIPNRAEWYDYPTTCFYDEFLSESLLPIDYSCLPQEAQEHKRIDRLDDCNQDTFEDIEAATELIYSQPCIDEHTLNTLEEVDIF